MMFLIVFIEYVKADKSLLHLVAKGKSSCLKNKFFLATQFSYTSLKVNNYVKQQKARSYITPLKTLMLSPRHVLR